MSETEEYACMKRIEGQMRLIFKEFKSAQNRIAGSSGNSDLLHDQRIDRLLNQLNQ